MNSLLFIMPLILISCAHKTLPQREQKIEHLDMILNLVKTSYTRGCIDGMNELLPIKTKGKRLEICVKKSEFHKDEIKSILYSPEVNQSHKATPSPEMNNGSVNGFMIKQR